MTATTPAPVPPPADAPSTKSPTAVPSPSLTKPVVFGVAGAGVGLVLGLVLGVAVIPTLGSLVGEVVSATQPGEITTAVETCGVESDQFIDVGDEGRSISMQSLGKESAGAAIDDIYCVLNELDTPDSVISRIGSTRALDGRQSGDWPGFSASWGYHPDNGLDIVIDVVRE